MKQAKAEAGTAARFGLVGAGATLTHLAVAQAVLAMGLSPVASNIIGFAVAFLAGLVGHYHFTFPGTGSFGRAFRRYGVIALGGFLFNNVVLIGLMATGRVSEQISLLVAILIVPATTFIASRFWGFVPSRAPAGDPGERSAR
jgi:putative flippase GtrA